MLKRAIISSLLIASSFNVLAEEDSHLHDSDIQPWRIGAEILLNSQLFEVDFGDLGGGAFATDDPGIDVNVDKGAFVPGNWLQFEPQGQLQFWDGDEWSNITPNAEYINITDALDNTVRIDETGVSGGLAVIGEIDSNGGLHAHIDFSLLDASDSLNGSQGAYSIKLKLFESAANSEVSVSYAANPVVIVFNQGLSEEAFEHAVHALDNSESAVKYDDATGVLTIPEVEAFGKHYSVKFNNQGNFLFQLIEAHESHEEMDEDSHDHDHE